jgi:hypothetical protein
VYEVIYYREFIGEVEIGLRPVINNAVWSKSYRW